MRQVGAKGRKPLPSIAADCSIASESEKTSEYQITVMVKAASGTQTWAMQARSAEEALELYEDGQGVIVESEIEVTDLEDVTLADVEKVN